MAVFRVEKNKNYTVMSNYHLKDKDLSLKSKGLLPVILNSLINLYVALVSNLNIAERINSFVFMSKLPMNMPKNRSIFF